ncbi:Lipopolysaccharide assembly protein B [Kordia antarctica]|uniref:Lipopolysaccharide assembly protein B n=1 Tax=Kordia antarctica TaxID=1218801 RepID=A0A7L4ZSI0_9FLAO|nr:hypothetical protein [Kordia antarctica]QHI38714.1 Lipopolysaccharide assembly protein B [Kordia antarctica]
MFYYYALIAVQIYCLYHAYKNQKPYYWYFIIFIIPGFGSMIYILTQIVDTTNIKEIESEITTIINPSKKVKDAEKQLEFSDTFQNRVNLADAYYEIGAYENASMHYESALKGNFQKDFYVMTQMIGAMNQSKNYEEVIRLAEEIKNKHEFKNSKAQYIYGLALDKLGRIEEAEQNLQPIDQRYSNYGERLVLAEFYDKNGKRTKAIEILDEIISESEHMTPQNRKLHRQTITNVRKFREELES